MALYYYLICFVISFLIFSVMLMRRIQQNINIMMTLIAVLCANGGYLAIAVSENVKQALIGSAFCYLGECFLSMFIFYIGADICGVKIGRVLRVVFTIVCAMVFCLACTPLFSGVYYKNVTLNSSFGASYLVKEYGPLHKVYYAVLLIWFVLIIGITIYAVFHQNRASYKTSIVYVIVMALNIATYILGLSGRLGIELLPATYVLSEFLILSIASRTVMYDMTTTVLNVWEKMENYAYIVLDRKKNYIGANALAKTYFPELTLQDVDLPIRAADPVLKSFINEVSAENVNNAGARERELRDINGHSFRTNITDFLNSSGKKKGFIIEFFDVTREQEYVHSIERSNEMLKAAEEKARKASAAKDEFLSSMSHEIRTPINTILGMNEMIGRKSNDNEISRYSRDIEHSGKLLLSIINDVLDFSKIEAGKMQLYPAPFDTLSLFSDAVSLLDERAPLKGLSVSLDISPDIPATLVGDDVRLRQIIMNLITNAVKYTSEGSVSLTAKAESLPEENRVSLLVSVSDTGTGISREDGEKIFTEFSRVGSVKNRHIEGTGLGLAISKNLALSMGGDIVFESEVGKGSVFTVELPLEVADITPMGELSKKGRGVKKKAYKPLFKAPDVRILAVDDNAMNLTVIKELLSETEMTIDTAKDGHEALELTREGKYDVILMDHMMPYLDGIETFKMLRDEEGNPNRSTPVIALTANAVSGSKEKYLSEGFSDYISKPVDPAVLEEKLLFSISGNKKNIDTRQSTERKETPPFEDTGDNALIDHDEALRYAGGDEDVLKKILSSFVLQNREYERKLPGLLKERRIKDIEVISHTIKSGARTIGAKKLSEEAAQIEALAKEENTEALKGRFEGFLNDLSKVLQSIEII